MPDKRSEYALLRCRIFPTFCLHNLNISNSRKLFKFWHLVASRSSAPSELYDPTMVRIIVAHNVEDGVNVATNSAPERFKLPRELICSRSPYFVSLFEGGTQARLYDVRPWVFKVFVGWLYRETICYDQGRLEPVRCGRRTQENAPKFDAANKDDCLSSKGVWNTEGEEDEQNGKGEHDFQDPVSCPHPWLFELYVFAKKYQARGFRLGVLEIIQMKLTKEHVVPCPLDTVWIVNNILPSDPLHQLLAHWYSDLSLESVAETMQEQVEVLSVLPTQFSILCHAMYKRKVAAEKCPIVATLQGSVT